MHYFGVWEDPDAALSEWLRVKDDLLAGRTPTPPGRMTLLDLINHFLEVKDQQRRDGDLTKRSFDDLMKTGEAIVNVLDRQLVVETIRVDDFERLAMEVAKGKSPTTRRNEISRCRMFFKSANRRLQIRLPYEDVLRAPTTRALRLHRQRQRATFGKKCSSPQRFGLCSTRGANASHDPARCQLWIWKP